MILHTSAWKNKALLFLVSFSHRGNCHLHSQLSFFLGRVYLDISHISNSNIGRCGIVSVGTIWCVTPHLDHEMIHHIDSSSASYKTRFSWRIYIYQVDFLRISLFIIHIFFSRVSWLICTIDGFNCLHPLYDWARNFRKNILCCYETICCPILGN